MHMRDAMYVELGLGYASLGPLFLCVAASVRCGPFRDAIVPSQEAACLQDHLSACDGSTCTVLST